MTRSERLEEIRKRAEAATPGPWESRCRSVGNEENDPSWPETDFLQFEVHGTDGSEVEVTGPKEVTWGRGDFYGRDAAFIAAARSDIPWLLDEVAKLNAALSGAYRDLEHLAGGGTAQWARDAMKRILYLDSE